MYACIPLVSKISCTSFDPNSDVLASNFASADTVTLVSSESPDTSNMKLYIM